jgi:arylsulfatase A-like enzyme/Tfp pilus assembly protein PilF
MIPRLRRVRRSLALAAAASACLLLLAACSSQPERVVLISIDTLRADHLACYGAERARTPALDRIAAQGVRFDQAISPAPLTLPSHSTIMTGLNPPQHGVRDNSAFRLADDIPTLAESFREAGFATAAFVAALVLDRRHGLDRGFETYGDHLGVRKSGRRAMLFPERPANQVVDEALDWLDTAPDRFLLWVHVFDPHARYTPPPDFGELFPDSPYAAEIAFADSQLERLLEAMDARWPDGRTLVIATGDHGESLGEHEEATHGNSVYDATQRVPLLMKGPGVPRGVVVSSVVRLADIAPTVLALFELPPLPAISGLDLRPAWKGEEAEPRVAYVETLATRLQYGWSPLLGLRTAEYKYIRAPRPELYELGTDPGELHDLAAARPAVARELDRVLEAQSAGERPIRPTVTLDAEDRARLESLGYVAPAISEGDPNLSRVGGDDPKDKRRALQLYSRANNLLSQDRSADALELLNQLAEDGPLFTLLRGEAHMNLEDYEAAEGYARRAVTFGLRLDTAYGLLAQALWHQQRPEEAIAAMEASLAENPDASDARIELGHFYEAVGDLEAAEKQYRRALEARAASVNAQVLLAAFLLRRGRTEEADALLAKLPEGAEPASKAVISLAAAETEVGRPERALQRLEEAIRSSPNSAQLALHYGALVSELRSPAEALAASERVLALDPDSAATLNNVAWLLLETGGDLDRALGLILRAAKTHGQDPRIADTLATIRLRRGEYRAALQDAERGLTGAEGLARARLAYVRAAAYEALGEPERAREELSAAFASMCDEAPPPWAAEAGALARELGVEIPASIQPMP